ncbi:MFS transporter [Enterococcus saccharolyticus]|uniref:Major facilitator superfamily transporter n=1 Tax=Enterococcus saccharolyticus subsp. saccharolyticus ATCC 43076 TaxID=1139996 RepID=S0JAS1_9ENTE|nr:MFS transporter [Enterococcus saccharolyticus]EOT29397.1 major facilitator superfamily transporter [Enterococcus saccharolyticus subsp. saccharolyticus ATCC 43076]EOT81195.1 major facilitator superfamily transporter [Enterococcus saccharolyticus subsp. saccharolyticus ATCC 43076]OJG88481.1 major facilitator superfamily transporter [Enterococcus saccharolyticus]
MKETEFSLAHWRRNFYLFLSGQFLSGITSMIVQYAIIWYLTEMTGSATVLSYATILGMLPMVLLSPFVGPLIDRWNKKLLLMITDGIVAIFAIILSLVGTFSAEFPIWLVFISLFVRSVAQTFQMPTIQSILPTIVPESELTKVNGQLGMVQSANFIIAPALGAFLFAIVPMNQLILLDVLGAILGISLLLFVAIPKIISQGEKVHLLTDTRFGVQQLVTNKGLWLLSLIGAAFTLIFMPAASMYPLMTMEYFNRSVGDAGLIEMVYALGMLAGGAIIGIFGKWKDRMKPIFAAYAVIGVAIGLSGILPATSKGFIYFIILNAFAGFATPYFNTLLMAMIQQSYDPKYLGRILGVLNSLMSITGPVGLIFAGPLADKIGVEKMFLLAGVGTLICGIITFIIPATRNYDKELQAKLNQEA